MSALEILDDDDDDDDDDVRYQIILLGDRSTCV